MGVGTVRSSVGRDYVTAPLGRPCSHAPTTSNTLNTRPTLARYLDPGSTDGLMPVHLLPYLVSSGTSISIAHPNAVTAVTAVLAFLILRRWAAGKSLVARLELVHGKQERDLHGTTWLVSCSLTGYAAATLLLSNLASRGAQLVLLLPASHFHPDVLPNTLQLLQLLRDGTRNELIFAEQCDLNDLESINAFTEKWQQGEGGAGLGAGPAGGRAASGIAPPSVDRGGTSLPSSNPRRCDGVVLMPYTLREGGSGNVSGDNELNKIEQTLLGRFHLVNSLLPSLLLLPPERDIRIVNWISPWYAAGARKFQKPNSNATGDTVQSLSSAVSSSRPGSKTSSSSTVESGRRRKAERNVPAVNSKHTKVGADRLAEPTVSDLGAVTLTTLMLSLELQRRLILLAEADPRPRNPLPGILQEDNSPSPIGVPGQGFKSSKSSASKRHWPNVNVVNVCPGFERDGEVSQWMWPSSEAHGLGSPIAAVLLLLRRIAVIFIWPFLFAVAKSPKAAAEQFVWGIVAPLNVPSGCTSILDQTRGSSDIARQREAEGRVGSGSIRLDSAAWSAEPEEGDTSRGPWRGIQPGWLYREGRIVRLPVPIQSQEELSELWARWEGRIESTLGLPIRRAGQGAQQRTQ
ncbi:unnamed protein product [Parajaminaea phylloscopi]